MSLEQEVVGSAFAAAGMTYPDGQGIGTPPPRGEWTQKMGTEEGAKELRATAEAKAGPCPVCKEKHEYQRRLPWGSLPWPSDRLQECKAFQALNPQQRMKVIQDQGGCVVCMSWEHTKARCNRVRHHTEGGPSIGCQEKEGSGVCGQHHHRLLNGSQSTYASVLRGVEQGGTHPGQNPQECRDCKGGPQGRPEHRLHQD